MAPIHVIPARDEANIEQKLVTLLLAAVQEKPDLIISVFAGTPAFGAYRLLVERARGELVDFSRVRFVVFDELVGATRDGCSARSAPCWTRRLFTPLAIPRGEHHLLRSRRRTARRRRRGSQGQLGVAGIDIALLSVDSRGHIGFHVTGSDLDPPRDSAGGKPRALGSSARRSPSASRTCRRPRGSSFSPRDATSRRSCSG